MKGLQEIISDKIILLNASTFLVGMSEVDMFIKMCFYIVSIIYTIFMIVRKWQEISAASNNNSKGNPD
jgi:ABC-type siderophore export system fused ATPase/permease subunit